jgi:hypothetical protein
MTITILVSGREKHEALAETVDLLAVQLPSPLDTTALSQQQVQAIMDRVEPELHRLEFEDRLRTYELKLVFLVDGLPAFQRSWSNTPLGLEGETSLRLTSGDRLFISVPKELSFKSVVLEN